MKLILLGSGGSLSMPRPCCKCKNCSKARRLGAPWARTGPALFLKDEAVLFDTPEEIRSQIERERIPAVKHVFYTHWHPDHTQGMRIFEHLNNTYPGEPRKPPINVYIPENAVPDFEKYQPNLWFFEKNGWIIIKKAKDRVPLKIGSTTITPLDFRRKDRVRYAYLIEKQKKRAVYAPCSVFEMLTDKNYEDLDVLFLELGWLGKTSERKKLPAGHAWRDHASFEENITLVKKLRPKKQCLYT